MRNTDRLLEASMEDNKKTEYKKAAPGKEKSRKPDKKKYWGKRGLGQKGENKKNLNNKAESDRPDRTQAGTGAGEKKEGKKTGYKRSQGRRDQKKKRTGQQGGSARVQAGQDKNIQGKSLQDKGVQEKSLQGKSVQEKSLLDKDVQEKTVQVQNIQEKTVQGRDVQEKTVQVQSIQGKTVQGRGVQETSVQVKSVQEKTVQGKGIQGKTVQVQSVEGKLLQDDTGHELLIIKEDNISELISVRSGGEGDTPKKIGAAEADDRPKVKVIGVRFRDNGKIYYFSADAFPVKVGDNVIVETARGVEYGKVVFNNREVDEKRIISTLKPVIRIANAKDDQIHKDNIIKSQEAYQVCMEKINKHGLEMKLIDCEYTFDNNKVLFYFTADGRIDFRELVKDLAAVFKTRIELRQIGVRDETKMKGGIGICGRELCCNTFLSEFIPVSIKMAKEQNLSLNPTKISGVCGRLMCCLKNEQDTYEYLNRKMPNSGDEVQLPDGRKGVVQGVNVLRQKVRVIITDEKDEKELIEYDVRDLVFHPRRKKDKEKIKMDGELKKLEALEKKERKLK